MVCVLTAGRGGGSHKQTASSSPCLRPPEVWKGGESRRAENRGMVEVKTPGRGCGRGRETEPEGKVDRGREGEKTDGGKGAQEEGDKPRGMGMRRVQVTPCSRDAASLGCCVSYGKRCAPGAKPSGSWGRFSNTHPRTQSE